MSDDMPANPPPPSLADIEAAATRIAPYVHRTPVFTSRHFDALSGAHLFFKCENFQKVGAFKIRGATNFVLSLSDADAARGVVTHSSGNHGQAVAAAARARGIPATVVMAHSVSKIKKAAVRGYGATVVDCEDSDVARRETAQGIVDATNATLIHPYNHPWIVAGQGTLALELVEQVAELNGSGGANLDAVIAPVGGGGCLSGVALAMHGLADARDEARPRIYGGEPLAADDAIRSLAAGSIMPSDRPETVADGLRTSLGELTFSVLSGHQVQLFTVTEERIVAVTREVWERMKTVVEPSAAVGLAALLDNAAAFRGQRVGVVFTGGNVDLNQLPWLS
jgi:threonine dehydratase